MPNGPNHPLPTISKSNQVNKTMCDHLYWGNMNSRYYTCLIPEEKREGSSDVALPLIYLSLIEIIKYCAYSKTSWHHLTEMTKGSGLKCDEEPSIVKALGLLDQIPSSSSEGSTEISEIIIQKDSLCTGLSINTFSKYPVFCHPSAL